MPLAGTLGATVTVRGTTRLRGRLRPPPDKSISHRALLLAALAEGESRIEGGSAALDPASTAACLRTLGVEIEARPVDERRVDWLVRSPGPLGWRQPDGVLDCGNSGTTLRLLAGMLAGVPLRVVLDGDASLRGRPVARIIEPLRAMGATLSARANDALPPLSVVGRRPLRPIEHRSAVPSAQVKSAVLLAGLAAEGTTRVREPVATRDHTERMLRARGVTVTSHDEPDGGIVVSLEGGSPVLLLDETIPGDLSAAAFWLVAGAAHPDAELVIEPVGLNPTRRAVVDILRAMGADIEERPAADVGSEPAGELRVRSSELRAIDLAPAEVARAIDEIPVLALAAACARGTSRLRGLAELRRKESDRVAGTADGLAALGAQVTIEGDDLVIEGSAGQPALSGTRGAVVDSLGDHRLAMTFAVAGLLGQGETTIHGADSAAVSDPGFFSDLERVRA